MTAAGPVLEARTIEARRGARRVLRGLSVSVQRGEIVGLLGPSGAGKSTLFDALAGEIPLLSGDVRLGDRSLGDAPLHVRARLGLSYLPQGPSVLHELSVEDNLATFARLAGTPLSARALADAIAQVGLSPLRAVRARDLSGGERRRLEIARAVLRRPVVLLADEPFAGMDPRAVADVAGLLRALASEGLAVLVSDHRATEVLALSHRAILLVDGAIAAEAPSAAFARHPAVSSRYLPDLTPTAFSGAHSRESAPDDDS